MSFSLEIKKELSEIRMKKLCCRIHFLLGLLINADIKENKSLCTTISGDDIFETVSRMIQNVCHKPPKYELEEKLGHRLYHITFDDEKIRKLLEFVERGEDGESDFWNGECSDGNCRRSFLRGVFISCGTVSDPKSGYYFELKFKNAARGAFVYKLLSDEISEPKILNRRTGTSVGLYYKNGTTIEDVLTYLGCVKNIFDFINTKIEREIRNSVNRSTNCVAGNIAKSVNAAQKQVAVICELEERGMLSMLPDELFETAKLRIENPSASLSELALVHDPPISKSGLTHRLAKIADFAEEKKKN